MTHLPNKLILAVFAMNNRKHAPTNFAMSIKYIQQNAQIFEYCILFIEIFVHSVGSIL
jgi:hypothetical protein